jgi:hypothetical protein
MTNNVYQDRAEQNLEYKQIENYKHWVKPEESLLMVLSANGYQDELNGEEFHGFVRTINMSVKSNLQQTGQRLGNIVRRGTQNIEA